MESQVKPKKAALSNALHLLQNFQADLKKRIKKYERMSTITFVAALIACIPVVFIAYKVVIKMLDVPSQRIVPVFALVGILAGALVFPIRVLYKRSNDYDKRATHYQSLWDAGQQVNYYVHLHGTGFSDAKREEIIEKWLSIHSETLISREKISQAKIDADMSPISQFMAYLKSKSNH